jgi:hypothetical protein
MTSESPHAAALTPADREVLAATLRRAELMPEPAWAPWLMRGALVPLAVGVGFAILWPRTPAVWLVTSLGLALAMVAIVVVRSQRRYARSDPSYGAREIDAAWAEWLRQHLSASTWREIEQRAARRALRVADLQAVLERATSAHSHGAEN